VVRCAGDQPNIGIIKMGLISVLALVIMTGFLFYTIDTMTKIQADVRLVASYVKQQQQKRVAASKAVAAVAAVAAA
jgi:hypothetical protein